MKRTYSAGSSKTQQAVTSRDGLEEVRESIGSIESDPDQLVKEEKIRQLRSLPGQEARFETLAVLVAAAVAFGALVWYQLGPEKGQEYFAGYILEQSLSVDNLFVFVLVFNYFKTPLSCQAKVLNYGIISAAVLRLALVFAGSELLQEFRPLLVVFAGILLYSSWRVLMGDVNDNEDDLSNNAVVGACRKLIPCTESYDEDRFFTTSSSGVYQATPLLLALAVVELSDVLFAVDSIPAVFGVTLDPYIIYSSNMFAILSLRSLYTFVSTVMSELEYLDKAVSVVLGFIGFKLLASFGGIEIPTSTSLLFVALVLAVGVGTSLMLPPGASEEES